MKTLGKTEIARLYGLSRPWFMRRFYLEFSEIELTEMKYDKRQQVFFPNQVAAIFSKMGNPLLKRNND